MGKKKKRDPQTELLETARQFPAFRAHGRELSLHPEHEQNRPPELPKPEPDNRELKEVFPALRTRPDPAEAEKARQQALDFQSEYERSQAV
jgi:hypothetical protein